MSVHGDTLCRVTSLSGARYWSVVGQFIDNETKRRGWTDLNFALNASLSRATIARLKAGAALGEASLAKIEGALDLPRDLLTYIAVGDENEIADAVSAKDPDLMRWLRKKFAEADAVIVLMPPASGKTESFLEQGNAAARRGRKSQVEEPEPHAE